MEEQQKDKAPLFKSWRNWYLFVLLFLVAQIIFFYLFTQYFS